MAHKVQLGGRGRIGSGNKMTVELNGYERSTHDLGYLWRSSMAAGPLVPFLVEPSLPGDTFSIKLDCDVQTHPTLGPLFGSFKVQLDVFEAPTRLYHGLLSSNRQGVGANMQNVLLPQVQADNVANVSNTAYGDLDNIQTNPSSLLAYLGKRGYGIVIGTAVAPEPYSALPMLTYYDIYNTYYSNQQEGKGAYIENNANSPQTISSMTIGGTVLPTPPAAPAALVLNSGSVWVINYGGTAPDLNQVMVTTLEIGVRPITDLAIWGTPTGTTITAASIKLVGVTVTSWGYAQPGQGLKITTFNLTNIDNMHQSAISVGFGGRLTITSASQAPYGNNATAAGPKGSQSGLALKTYQSDRWNNWLDASMLSTANPGTFSTNIDSLNLAYKVWRLLNKVIVSGNSYNDWVSAVYDEEPFTVANAPMYKGGLSKELVFQQVVSNSATSNQPLGTLGGRGTMGHKHKGGHIEIKCREHGTIMGIVSLTPRIDYSQGNRWYMRAIQSMNDYHKPDLDQIGFQDTLTEEMAWWDCQWNGTSWTTRSIGKQPAWLQYQTNFNRTFGNFAMQNNEMFMTLNRRYSPIATINGGLSNISDLTSYIDPTHYNFIFAETALDAQNFWVQISVDMTVRRKMSAKVMPNL